MSPIHRGSRKAPFFFQTSLHNYHIHNHVKEHCLTHWHTALPVRRGEMIQLIRPGNQSAFAFMTINNSTTPTLTSCSTPYFSPYNHHYCSNTNFEYLCYKCDKVFMETIQSELHVRKISIKYI